MTQGRQRLGLPVRCFVWGRTVPTLQGPSWLLPSKTLYVVTGGPDECHFDEGEMFQEGVDTRFLSL